MDKGKILEDLDALAGNVAWRHAVMGNGVDCRPPILVTAAVDEVRIATVKPAPLQSLRFLTVVRPLCMPAALRDTQRTLTHVEGMMPLPATPQPLYS